VRLVALALLVLAGGCPYCPVEYTPPAAYGSRWDEADALFHQDPRWLGGDGAYSIDLRDGRSVWLFGDSFIATSDKLTRRESTLVRSSIAVMTGRDPITATMEFQWREDMTGPRSFFAGVGEAGDHWLWPVDGYRLEHGPLLIFLAELRPTPGEGLGFAGAGFRAVRIPDPDLPPAQWTLEPVASLPAPANVDATVGNCVGRDGDFLYAMSVDGDQEHHARMARWPLFVVGEGDLTEPEWPADGRWIGQAELTKNPDVLIEGASTECSLTGDGWGGWIYVGMRGFGHATVVLRPIEHIDGHYLELQDVFTPNGDFTYAGKAHGELDPNAQPDLYGYDLVATYADNSFTFEDLLDPLLEKLLYWPHFVRISFSYPSC
jgi:hypothetical protein